MIDIINSFMVAQDKLKKKKSFFTFKKIIIITIIFFFIYFFFIKDDGSKDDMNNNLTNITNITNDTKPLTVDQYLKKEKDNDTTKIINKTITEIKGDVECTEVFFEEDDKKNVFGFDIEILTIATDAIKISVDDKITILSFDKVKSFGNGDDKLRLEIKEDGITYFDEDEYKSVELLIGCKNNKDPKKEFIEDKAKNVCNKLFQNCKENFRVDEINTICQDVFLKENESIGSIYDSNIYLEKVAADAIKLRIDDNIVLLDEGDLFTGKNIRLKVLENTIIYSENQSAIMLRLGCSKELPTPYDNYLGEISGPFCDKIKKDCEKKYDVNIDD